MGRTSPLAGPEVPPKLRFAGRRVCTVDVCTSVSVSKTFLLLRAGPASSKGFSLSLHLIVLQGLATSLSHNPGRWDCRPPSPTEPVDLGWGSGTSALWAIAIPASGVCSPVAALPKGQRAWESPSCLLKMYTSGCNATDVFSSGVGSRLPTNYMLRSSVSYLTWLVLIRGFNKKEGNEVFLALE